MVADQGRLKNTHLSYFPCNTIGFGRDKNVKLSYFFPELERYPSKAQPLSMSTHIPNYASICFCGSLS